MYTKPYNIKNSGISIPENYDGMAFMGADEEKESCEEEKPCDNEPCKERSKNPWENENRDENSTRGDTYEKAGLFSSLLSSGGAGIFSLFGGKSPDRLLPTKIGTEELLILGIAAFLFFSSEGDRSLALMLLLLLFIN